MTAIEPPEKLKDTLGAGDSFFGGLIAGLVRGLSIEDAFDWLLLQGLVMSVRLVVLLVLGVILKQQSCWNI